ncbi:MAG: InlB B-repeat-containing protein [Bacteroidales bacterium]|jgi:uncharacterized repeat protein (TIGR02543 family)|nr:InlB B-repeat-containing protein [Bacteroidales bacterium]
MKNIWIIILISILLGFVSCSSKDDSEDETVYTVTFDTDGGSPSPSVQQVKAGDMAVAPNVNPVKTGYVFLFWYLDGVKTAYNFQTPVIGNITLYARWEDESAAEYWQVSWELNGGKWPSEDNHVSRVVKGGTLAEPAVPVKSDDTFEGWYKEADFTNRITFPYDVSTVTGNFILYAKWKNSGGDPSSVNHNISSAAEWNAAVNAVNTAGNNKTHTFTVTKSFSLPGVGTTTLFTKELTDIAVTIKGQGSPAPEISVTTDKRGYLIYLASVSQKIVLEDIVLKGHPSNNAAVLCVKTGELVIGNGAVITGNTNTAGGSGGVDVGGKLILDGGEIVGNVSGTASATNGHGGGIWVDDFGELIMVSGNISGNKVYGQGGGVYVDLFARFTMKGGNIFGNTAWAASSGARGGGVYNSGGDFYMSGGRITGYDWIHGNVIDLPEHYSGDLNIRDNCNSVVIGVTAMGSFGAALYSPAGDNHYGTFTGETFTQTGSFGNSIHIERNIEIADGVRLNRFEANGKTLHPYRGGMDYWGHFFNAATENVFIGLTTIYGEWIALDMLVPDGRNRLVAGTYTFGTAGTSAVAYTFVDNDYTSYVQDADGNKLKMTGGTVKVTVTGTGDDAVYTITVDCMLENDGKVKGTYRGPLKWYDLTGT